MRAGRFPQRSKRGSCVVTIDKTPTKGYNAFTVVHYDANGARCRRMFTSHAQALRAAKATAAELAVGRPEVHTLTGHELVIYRRALKALNGSGIDLDVAVTQFAQATKLLGDVTVIARHYLKCVTADEAQRWFGIMPNGSANGAGAGHPQ